MLLERVSSDELTQLLQQALAKAGNPKLMTPELSSTLCEHAAGNPRTLMNLAAELLALGAQREARQLDEKLFFEAFALPPPPAAKSEKARHR